MKKLVLAGALFASMGLGSVYALTANEVNTELLADCGGEGKKKCCKKKKKKCKKGEEGKKCDKEKKSCDKKDKEKQED